MNSHRCEHFDLSGDGILTGFDRSKNTKDTVAQLPVSDSTQVSAAERSAETEGQQPSESTAEPDGGPGAGLARSSADLIGLHHSAHAHSRVLVN